MSKNQSDLEEELNESLDFLEEEAPSLPGNSSTNYISKYLPLTSQQKQIGILSAVGVIGVLIIWWIMHSKPATSHMNMPVPIKSSVTSSNVNHVDLKNTPKDLNTKEQTINKDSEKLITAPPLLPKIEQTPSNQPNVQLPNQNNLTWQELKKSITEETTGNASIPQQQQPQSTIVVQQKATDPKITNSTSEISTPIETFEKSIKFQSSESIPNQLNHNNQIQESIQELKDVTTNITADLLTNVNQIKELQNNLKELSRSILNISGTITNNMDSIDSKILNLTRTIDNLSIEIKNLKKHLQDEDSDLIATIKKSETDLFSNSPEYVVHAVIPGRAWLKSSSGQIITVTEGDLLGDYGKVAFIDPNSNIVRTSSGVVFR